MNSRRQGALGVAIAIHHYTEQGYQVFLPVSECGRIDIIIVGDDGVPVRVEVKTTTSKRHHICLKTSGGNRSGTGKVRLISSNDVDRVLCVNLNTHTIKEFAATDLEGMTAVKVS